MTMNIMNMIGIAQTIIAEGENSELVKSLKEIAIQTINTEHNCGRDRAEMTTILMFDNVSKYLKKEGII